MSTYSDEEVDVDSSAAGVKGISLDSKLSTAKKGLSKDKEKEREAAFIDKTKASADEVDLESEELGVIDLGGESISTDSHSIYNSLVLRYDDVSAEPDQAFVIDGDSLILELLADPLIKFSGKATSESEKALPAGSGGEFLHFFFLLERSIDKFRSGGRTFRVQFFDITQNLYNRYDYLTLRELSISHLEHHCKVLVNRFEGQ
jgi:hypothetical protein